MTVSILEGDCLETMKTLPDCSVQCVVTSPPYYGLRDYGTARWKGGDTSCDHTISGWNDNMKPLIDRPERDGTKRQACLKCDALRIDQQIGLEETPEAYVENLVAVFREVKRVLKDDGTLWLNLGDSYWGSQQNGGDQTKRVGGGIKQLQRQQEENKNVRVTIPSGCKPKDMMGIPWMVAFALRADGWYLRSDIIWHKPNPMPESVRDRPTKSHEHIFLLTKSARYYYNAEAIYEPAAYDGRKDTRMKGGLKYQNGFAPANVSHQSMALKGHERWSKKIVGRTEKKMTGTNYGGNGSGLSGHSGYYDANGNLRTHVFEDGIPARNKRDVWTVTTKPYKEAHFATFPPDLIEPCILAGSREGDTVLDPFNGSGTTGVVAVKYQRHYIGCELNPKYIELTNRRLSQAQPLLITGRSDDDSIP